MSVAGIASTSFSQISGDTLFERRQGSFKEFGQAITDGNLTRAQRIYNSLAYFAQRAGLSPDSQLGQDFAAIGQALQAGDLNTAQQAFATLQQDLQGGPPSTSQAPTVLEEIVINITGASPGTWSDPSTQSPAAAAPAPTPTPTHATASAPTAPELVINITENSSPSAPELTLNFQNNGSSGSGAELMMAQIS